MLDTWEEYTFLALVLAAFFSAALTKDKRLHAGIFTLLVAWVVSLLAFNFLPSVPIVPVNAVVNLVVLYIFLQLHYRREGEAREPIWPVFIMGLEFLIFMSHLAYLFFGWAYYIISVDFLFGIELLTITVISVPKAIGRFFFSPQGNS